MYERPSKPPEDTTAATGWYTDAFWDLYLDHQDDLSDLKALTGTRVPVAGNEQGPSTVEARRLLSGPRAGMSGLEEGECEACAEEDEGTGLIFAYQMDDTRAFELAEAYAHWSMHGDTESAQVLEAWLDTVMEPIMHVCSMMIGEADEDADDEGDEPESGGTIY